MKLHSSYNRPQQSGIAGNMIVGAFVDMGVNPNEMKTIMEK